MSIVASHASCSCSWKKRVISDSPVPTNRIYKKKLEITEFSLKNTMSFSFQIQKKLPDYSSLKHISIVMTRYGSIIMYCMWVVILSLKLNMKFVF